MRPHIRGYRGKGMQNKELSASSIEWFFVRELAKTHWHQPELSNGQHPGVVVVAVRGVLLGTFAQRNRRTVRQPVDRIAGWRRRLDTWTCLLQLRALSWKTQTRSNSRAEHVDDYVRDSGPQYPAGRELSCGIPWYKRGRGLAR